MRVNTGEAVQDFLPEEYIYSETRNSISFVSFIPEPLDTVEITYEVLASLPDAEAQEDLSPPE